MRTSGIWKDAAVAGHHLARDLDGDRGTKGLETGLVLITYFGMRAWGLDGGLECEVRMVEFLWIWRFGGLQVREVCLGVTLF
tara:strand:+ start:14581 stop:14826 length:246 start_codon:yes stop_codon:yes gene_type:complete